MQRWGWDNSLCFNRGFDSLHLTTEIYSIKCTYLYLKFIFYHVISIVEQFVLFWPQFKAGQWTFFSICYWDQKNPNKSTVPLFKFTEVSSGIFFHILLLPCCCECVYLITHFFLHLIEFYFYVIIWYNYILLIKSIFIEYYMAFFIWHVISTR
jgi:hypothetical protein